METPKDLVKRVAALVDESEEKRWYAARVNEDPAYRAEFFKLCEQRGLAAEVDGHYIKVSKK